MGGAAGLIWSLGAVTNRLAKHIDAFQYLIWRSIGVVVVIEILARTRRQPSPFSQSISTGRVMKLGSLGLLVASFGFVYALKNTSAANAALLSSLTPFVAALLGRLALRERIRPLTLVAMVVGGVGLVVMVVGDLGRGSMKGNIAATASSLGFGLYIVCVRSRPRLPWAAAMPGYAVPMIVLCGAVTIANRKTLVPPLPDIALALLHGMVFIVVGTTLFNLATLVVPPVGMALLAQTETIAVPLLIALWFGDTPPGRNIVGALIILASLVINAVATPRTPPMALETSGSSFAAEYEML